MIEQLHVENFKSFRSATIRFGPLTLLVGANASGKSNLRDALRFLHGIGRGYSLPEIIGEKYGPGGELQWRGIRGGAEETAFWGSKRFSMEVLLKPTRRAARYRYHLTVDLSDERLGPRVEAEGLRVLNRLLYDSSPPDDLVAQHGEHELRVRHPRGGNHRKSGKVSVFTSARTVLSQFPMKKGEPAETKEQCKAVMDAFASIRFLDLDPDAMRRPSQPGQVVMGDKGENLSSVLQAICSDEKRKAALLEWVHALTPMDADDMEFRRDLGGKVLLYLMEGKDRSVSAHSASDGTLRFLAMVAALHSQDTGRLYFFEEIDNGIHPARLHLLLRLLEEASNSQGVQVVATTHNPALLSYLDEKKRADAHLVFRPDDATDSQVKRLGELDTLERVVTKHSLGDLLTSGWLEDAALFAEPVRDES